MRDVGSNFTGAKEEDAAHFVGRRIARRSEAGQYLDRRHQRSRATIPSHTATARTITPTVVRNSTTRRRLFSVRTKATLKRAIEERKKIGRAGWFS